MEIYSLDIFLIPLLLATIFSASSTSQAGEHLTGGDFELGIVDMEIQRDPRFPLPSGFAADAPYLDNHSPLEGAYSLNIPGAPEPVVHRITHKTLRLVAGESYDLSARIKSADSVSVRVELYAGGIQLYDRTYRVGSGVGTKTLEIVLEAAAGPLFTANEVAHTLSIWVSGKSDILLDGISLSGPYGVSGPVERANLSLEPAEYPGIYDIGDTGSFTVRSRGVAAGKLHYEILDPVYNDAVISSGILGSIVQDGVVRGYNIPIFSERRGYYLVRVYLETGEDAGNDSITRAYAVIDPTDTGLNDPFFGICMEENGRNSKIDAFVTPDYLYNLVSKIGAGSVRMFSSASPDILSENGRLYDFYELDTAVQLAGDYGLDPLVILGSNTISRIPKWLRTTTPTKDNNFDLTDGKKENRLAGGNYFDVSEYTSYLGKVFGHLHGRVQHYSLWNEPGHKFDLYDFLRIASATRETQLQWDPQARLVGYSSTTRSSDRGKGSNEAYLPSYINNIGYAGGLVNIDTLSYHSSHVFNFMGSNYDRRNHETGFVDRLNRIPSREGEDTLPVWDTERGIPWYSSNDDRIDFREGRGLNLDVSGEGVEAKPVMEAAMQMPMVYAAAKSQGVERLFWFYLESGPAAILRTMRLQRLFDAQMEPTPYLPVYDAMTEMLADSEFIRLWDNENGNRFYLFQRGADAIAITYNWKQIDSTLTVVTPQASAMTVFDIMGNVLPASGVETIQQHEISVGESPKYIIMAGVNVSDIEIQ